MNDNDGALRLVTVPLGDEGEHAGRGVKVVVTGELDLDTAPQLADALQALVDDGVATIVLDTAQVEFLDSTGLRAIIHCSNELAASGGRLVIEGMSGAVQRVLEVSGLIEHYRSEAKD